MLELRSVDRMCEYWLGDAGVFVGRDRNLCVDSD